MNMSGTSFQKNISGAFPISKARLTDLLIPFVLGMLAIVAHAGIKLHLGIPGHNGIVFMALLLISKKTSKIRWSSLIFTAGVGSMLYIPFNGLNDPFVFLVYLWPGITFDLFHYFRTNLKSKFWLLSLSGGLAYSTIPLSRFVLGISTGIFHKSVTSGLLLPFFLFFVFGFIGTSIGIGITGTGKLITKKNE